MFLLEYVRGLNPAQKIMIGSNTAFFYCGTAQNFLDNIDVYNSKITTILVRGEYAQRDLLRAAARDVPTYREYCAGLDDAKSPDYSLVAYERVLKQKEATIQSRLKQYLQSRKRCDEYIALSKRAVKETNKSGVAEEKDVIKVLITGKETGKYWLYKEAEGFEPLAISTQGGTYE